MKMTVDFMLTFGDECNCDYEIVDTVIDYDNPLLGYDVCRTTTDDFRKIHYISDDSGIEYEADAVIKAKDGDYDIYVVSIWNPIEI